jgi:hypothetical protein
VLALPPAERGAGGKALHLISTGRCYRAAPWDVLQAVEEAHRISGGDSAGAWRLLVLRAERRRPEDTVLLAALARVLARRRQSRSRQTDAYCPWMVRIVCERWPTNRQRRPGWVQAGPGE